MDLLGVWQESVRLLQECVTAVCLGNECVSTVPGTSSSRDKTIVYCRGNKDLSWFLHPVPVFLFYSNTISIVPVKSCLFFFFFLPFWISSCRSVTWTVRSQSLRSRRHRLPIWCRSTNLAWRTTNSTIPSPMLFPPISIKPRACTDFPLIPTLIPLFHTPYMYTHLLLDTCKARVRAHPRFAKSL